MTELDEVINKEEAALKSLVEFRRFFFASKEDVPPAAMHYRWSDILLRGDRHFAVEAFRESAKTQIVIRANLLHALTYPQACRSYLVVICATQRSASKKLQEAGRELKASSDFGALVEKIIENSAAALEVSYRTGQRVRIEAYGKGAAVRGLSWGSKRPDLVNIDDPQDAEDARSETVTETDWDWFLSDILFLGKQSRIFLIGNNLGERCIIERVIKHAEQLGFDTERTPIMDENQGPAWPEKWSYAHIEKEREAFAMMGKLDIWYREKMCRCISPVSQKFKKEYFRYYDELMNVSEMAVYTTVDPAVSLKPGADYSAIVTVGVSKDGHWFVLDVDQGRYDPSQNIDAIFSAVRKWRPLCVGVETVAYQSALQHFLQKEMPRRNEFFKITPLKAEKKKELRIDTLQPRFVVGSVWFRSRASWLEDIQRELLSYPHGAHDDIIDALAYVEQLDVAQGFAITGGNTTSSELFWEERRYSW